MKQIKPFSWPKSWAIQATLNDTEPGKSLFKEILPGAIGFIDQKGKEIFYGSHYSNLKELGKIEC